MKQTAPEVDDYIRLFTTEKRKLLTELRHIILSLAPDAMELMSYNMPAYKLHKRILVYFAGHTHHIGFYPGAGAVVHFADELTKYKTSKGSIQFPLDGPLPAALIKRIVKFRMKQNHEKLQAKKR